MKKREGKERHAEAHADPRQRPLFEGWGRPAAVVPDPVETRAYRRDEARDRED